MASAMRVFRKFQSSDGRIKVATLSGVSALVAVIALLVGVLPVFAAAPGPTGEGVQPVPVEWGGGSGACDDVLLSSGDGTPRGPSAARYEAHINNPRPGDNFVTGNDPDGTQIKITVGPNTEFLEFSIGSGMVAYDVVVNGGKKSNHYAYAPVSDPVSSDSHLSAPTKENQPSAVHKLSHVTICYDMQPVTLVCDGASVDAIIFGDGSFTGASAQVFNNSVEGVSCDGTKQALFFADNNADPDELTLEFQGDGGKVAGRLDVTKDFGEPDPLEDFDDLTYDRDGSSSTFVEVPWCETRAFAEGDGTQFSDWLPTGTESGLYPDLPSGETACKVAEDEDLSGTQVTVVYFEFEDPNFR